MLRNTPVYVIGDIHGQVDEAGWAATQFLRIFGGRQPIHGHTPIPNVTQAHNCAAAPRVLPSAPQCWIRGGGELAGMTTGSPARW